MSSLSKAELEAIREQLEKEEALIFQFTAFAGDANDPQLRTLFEQIAAKHRIHWNTLCKLLNA